MTTKAVTVLKTKIPIPSSRWDGTTKNGYNSRTASDAVTKPGRPTLRRTPVREVEARGCKPVTSGNQASQRSPYTCTSATTMFTMHLGMAPWLSHDVLTSHNRLSHRDPETKSLRRIEDDLPRSYSSHSPPVILLYTYEATSNISFFAGFQRVSRSWLLISKSDHVIIKVIICNLNEAAHNRRILLYICRTFFKFHCMNILIIVNSKPRDYS